MSMADREHKSRVVVETRKPGVLVFRITIGPCGVRLGFDLVDRTLNDRLAIVKKAADLAKDQFYFNPGFMGRLRLTKDKDNVRIEELRPDIPDANASLAGLSLLVNHLEWHAVLNDLTATISAEINTVVVA
jgi:hypothetical protein